MKKVWTVIFLMQFTVLCLFAVVVVSLSKAPTPNDPALTSVLPIAGEKGSDAVVDYDQINSTIEEKVAEKVAALPTPKDGLNGTNGSNGQNGHTPVKGVDYSDGATGPQGPPGVAIQQVELQTNPFTSEIEWRCSGDMLWTTLASNPILTDACL